MWRRRMIEGVLLDWGLPLVAFTGMIGCAMAILSMTEQIEVIDGDTIRRGEITYRLVGFDAPETIRAKCDEERELGEAAARRLEQLIAAGHAQIHPVTNRKDKYGRGLARLHINSRDVGKILIEEGLARPYDGRSRRTQWCSTDDR